MDTPITRISTSSPLFLSEILSNIFSFLSQHTLKTYVRFVCKKWLLIARELIRVPIIWDFWSSNKARSKVLRRFHLITDLCLDPEKLKHNDSIYQLGSQIRDQIRACKAPPRLRRLELVNFYYLQSVVFPILPLINNLTDIYIVDLRDRRFPLGEILEQCPRLLRLQVYTSSNLTKSRFTNYYTIEYNNSSTGNSSTNTVGVAPYNIKHLVMKRLFADQKMLEAILDKCPQLQTLKLETIRNIHGQIATFDRPMFTESVSKMCPLLKRFHFSIIDEALSPVCAKSMIQSTHKLPLDTISVLNTDIYNLTFEPFFSHLLDPAYEKIITTLEITTAFITTSSSAPANGWNVYHIHALHNVLCSATSLKHLIAPMVFYSAEYIDFSVDISRSPISKCRSPGCPALACGHNKRGIWGCRGLETMHLSFSTWFKSNDDESHRISRAIFGYISTVCPKLIELSIYGASLNIDLKGGLCLLTKLRGLERLTVRTRILKRLKGDDLNWMSKRSQPYKVQTDEYPGHNRPLTVDDLRDLASTVKLDAYLEQLQDTGCWPMLEYLGIRHTDNNRSNTRGEYLPNLIAHIRPDIQFSCKFKEYIH